MSSRKESSCTNQNTLTTSIAKIGSAVNSPRNRLFQIRQQQTPVSSSSSIYNPPQRRVVNLDTWPNNAGSFDNNNAAMAQMYSSRWGVYDNTTFNIGYNDGGFSKLPPLNMNGIDNNSMNNVDHNQFSPKHTMMNNSPNMSPNNYMQQNMNNNPFTTVQTSNSNTLNDSLFHQNQQQQQNLNTHNNHQINVTMQNSNFHHTNNQINNTTTNFQTQHSQQPCIDLNTTSFNPQHTIEQQNNTNTFFQQSQQTQHNMDHRQTINSVNNTSNFQQQNIFNQFDQQQTEINSAIPQSLVDIVMEMEEETPEQTFEQMLTDHNKNIQNTCSYGNSPVPETFNDDSMMDISDMNDIFTNIPSIRPPSTWNFDIVEQNNKMNIENFGSSTSQLINELKKENLKAEPAVSINSLSTTSMITEQNSQNFQQTFENTQQTLQNQQDMKNSQLQQTLHSEQIFQQNRQNHQPFVQQSHRPNQQHAFQEQNSELSQKPQQTQQTQQTQQQFLNQQTQQTQENLQQNQKTKEQHQILQQNKQNNQQTSTPQRQEQQKYQQQQQQQQSQRQEEEEEEDIPSEIFDKNGETFLHLAIHNRDIKQCLEILETPVLNKAINVKNASKEVPILILLKKCFTQCDKILEKFLDLDVRVKAIDHSANNIFHLSISEAPDESQCLQILDILFKYSKYKEDYKWLMNQRNVSGYTPSHIATIRGYGKAIWKFHENEANLNLQDFQAQKTCLVMAAENQNWPLVTELIKMNVNVNVAARGDQRAINYAIKSSRADIITLLFEHDTECLKWKDIVPSEEIEKLVRKLIRKKRRKKKEGKVERVE